MQNVCGKFAVLLAFLFFASIAWAAPGSIRVVTDLNYPPYVFLNDDGYPEGYEVEIWHLWEKKTGIHVELSAMYWAQAQKAVQQGDADVIDMIFRTQEREPLYDFSKGYATLPVSIYVDHSIRGIQDIGTLHGFLVGVEAGDACVQRLQAAGIESLRLYPDYESMITAARAGNVKVLCMDDAPASYFLYRNGMQLNMAKAFGFYSDQFHWAVRKGDTATYNLVAQGMNLITPAERAELERKWLKQPLEYRPYWRVIRTVLLAMILALLILLFWICTLRKMVQRKTAELREKNKVLGRQAAALDEEKALLRAIFESSPDAMCLKDRDGVYVECNAATLRVLGVARDAIIGRTAKDVQFSDGMLQSILVNDRKVLESGEMMRREIRGPGSNGAASDFEIAQVPIRASDNRTTGILCVARDISDRKRTERELRIAAVAFQSHDAIVVTDEKKTIQRVNLAFTRITGYLAEEVIGKSFNILNAGLRNGNLYSAIWEVIAEKGVWQGSIWNKRKSGELYLEHLTVSSVEDEQGVVQHYVGMISDQTVENETRAFAERLTNFDSLTDLPNRTQLEERIGQALSVSDQSHRRGALILIDLDNFAVINTVHGHKVGDELLCHVAQRMRLMVPKGDTLARFSGDEFAVLSLGVGENPIRASEAVRSMARALGEALSQPYRVDGVGAILCTVSIGVTLLSGRDTTIDTLLAEAELAMFKAKSAGKNAVRFFEPGMQKEVEERNVISNDLREALSRGDLVLHYQPQVDQTEIAVGAEALVRWTHPRRGVISPAHFIPIAEQSDLITLLGRWSLKTACRQLACWAVSPRTSGLTLAVNVSPWQFMQSDFEDSVFEELTAFGADPTRLKIEITENTVMENIGDAVFKLGRLKDQGISISLDDFGTGNSSLSYLTRLPLDQLKIDKSFVQRLPNNRDDALITQTVIGMAHGMGLEVVAEGVETRAQFEFLNYHSCDLFQGYLFAKPMPIAVFDDSVVGS